MTDQVINQNKYSEFRSTYKYYIGSYIALYQLKTGKEEKLNHTMKHLGGNCVMEKFAYYHN